MSDAPIPTVDSSRAALLVMDMQPSVLTDVPDSDAVLAKIARAIAVARDAGVQVGFVRVGFDDADYARIPATNKAFGPLADMVGTLHADSPETAIHQQLAPRPEDIVVRKTRVGAFSTTDLDRRLRDRSIDTVILSGVHTSGVVLSTVRDAADRDYAVLVLEDGVADPDPQLHSLLTGSVFAGQAYVIPTHGLARVLTPGYPERPTRGTGPQRRRGR
ncbi:MULTISPECIES: cysteine hydrolase family protein [unclassified Pseudofrankia]|uniref:cysteine hydrolase family protein n=1 Tax=unclassified Pseudofrankia TaxID=2994372 RepID=UPI0008D9E5AC|nr:MULTISPECIES: cysteine hydrolase [unclassified Pseudofrankia]MDT3446568.1 cysteine hydrolase [Pseudofrankia sp. BMG5.37]OHV59925.1 hypothetical protein BCD48_40935 [Pseudofrankia sp. BMG5.36]